MAALASLTFAMKALSRCASITKDRVQRKEKVEE